MKIDGENLLEQCPEPETLAAYIDGKLASEEKAFTESHLAKCKYCRGAMELVSESESEAPGPAPLGPCE